jgi:hypothetical protein
MIPIVEPDANQKDKRKGKKLLWKEAKISLAHPNGSRTPIYAATIEGGVEIAGRQLFECAVRAGFGVNSHVHAVGDGAPWIVGQVEERFGVQGAYLIDFYHVCEYLSEAAKAIMPDLAAQEAWMDAQEDALKTGRLENVRQRLPRHREPPEVDDERAPVRRCHRYLSARRNQELSRGLGQGLADRLRRDRKRSPLYCATTPEAPRLGGAQITPTTCSRSASPAKTATGPPIGPRSVKIGQPSQIGTGPPYHGNPPRITEIRPRDCITLDRTRFESDSLDIPPGIREDSTAQPYFSAHARKRASRVGRTCCGSGFPLSRLKGSHIFLAALSHSCDRRCG